LRIEVTKGETLWRADCLDLPGSPPCGCGYNKYEAIGSLIIQISKNNDCNPCDAINKPTWAEKFLKEKIEIIECTQ
jgi:hypothetical protein